MRDTFHGQLEQLGTDLALMCGLVSEAMTRASQGLLTTDLTLVEHVITDDTHINQLATRCEQHACSLLALQAPVAKDLRTVITAIKAAEKIERMGDLAKHVAQVTRLRHPKPAVPPELAALFAEMARCSVAACNSLERSIAAPTGQDWPAMVSADNHVDRLHTQILDTVGHADPPYPVQVGVDAALLARYFERFADQAVSIARRLDYTITGTVPDDQPPI